MAVAVTLVLTSLLFCGISAYYTLRLKSLFKSKSPYSHLLIIGIILQLVIYILFLFNFAFLAFLPRQRHFPLLASISASFFRFIPLLLVVCIVRGFHARLAALRVAQPTRQQGRFTLVRWMNWMHVFVLLGVWIFLTITGRTVVDALNGRREHAAPVLNQIGELVHALIFTSLTYLILVFSRRMNGFLLLPDQVLLALNTRITPIFLLRSSYTITDAILPLIHPQIRILTPSLTISADGFIWLVVFYNLYCLAGVDDNWIDQASAHLVRGMDAPPVDTRDGVEPVEEPPKVSRWSRLISPLRPHRTYGAVDEESARPEEQQEQPASEPIPDVAIVQGVAASGTQLYAQTGPMAPAWLLQDVAVNGKAGTGAFQDRD